MRMKINLILNYFIDSDENRKKEIDDCILKNLNNQYISKIILVVENRERFITNHSKIEYIDVDKMPTYNCLFDIANEHDDCINIISNIDMEFDNMEYIYNMKDNECFAMIRYNIGDDGVPVIHPSCDAQDAWIFKGKIKPIEDADFTLGRYGGDNHIAYLIKNAGYEISSPSSHLKMYHRHKYRINTLHKDFQKNRVRGKYEFVHAS